MRRDRQRAARRAWENDTAAPPRRRTCAAVAKRSTGEWPAVSTLLARAYAPTLRHRQDGEVTVDWEITRHASERNFAVDELRRRGKAKMNVLFDVYDVNGDGVLAPEELRAKLYIPSSDAEATALVDRVRRERAIEKTGKPPVPQWVAAKIVESPMGGSPRKGRGGAAE